MLNCTVHVLRSFTDRLVSMLRTFAALFRSGPIQSVLLKESASEINGAARKANPMQTFEKFMQAGKEVSPEILVLASTNASQQESAIVAAMARHEDLVRSNVQEMEAAAELARTKLLPAAKEGQALSLDELKSVNQKIAAVEGPALPGVAASRTETFTEALLRGVEPGSKLYPALVKKVETFANRTTEDFKTRETERLRARLLAGKVDAELDDELQRIQSEHDTALTTALSKYTESFALSDHLQVQHSIPVAGSKPLIVGSWNVLEYPGESNPVMNGVRPVIDILVRGLELQKADVATVSAALVKLVCTKEVCKYHTDMVLDYIKTTLGSGACQVVLLQEVNLDEQKAILDLCSKEGWHGHFSSAIEDKGQCDAMTAVICKEPFDEVGEIEVKRNNKRRNFAAARLGSCWIVSCHLPLLTTVKEVEDLSMSFGSYPLKIIQQVWAKFGMQNPAVKTVVIGGDWNAPIRDRISLFKEHLPDGCEDVSLQAPPHLTTFNDYLVEPDHSPIDGFVTLRKHLAA